VDAWIAEPATAELFAVSVSLIRSRLTLPAVAVRLRHGVRSRRNCRKVAGTRTVADLGWRGPAPSVTCRSR
jgi:hypothetical protein